MGKTLHYGRNGQNKALQDRIDRHVLHRRTPAWYEAQQQFQAERVAREVTRAAYATVEERLYGGVTPYRHGKFGRRA